MMRYSFAVSVVLVLGFAASTEGFRLKRNKDPTVISSGEGVGYGEPSDVNDEQGVWLFSEPNGLGRRFFVSAEWHSFDICHRDGMQPPHDREKYFLGDADSKIPLWNPNAGSLVHSAQVVGGCAKLFRAHCFDCWDYGAAKKAEMRLGKFCEGDGVVNTGDGYGGLHHVEFSAQEASSLGEEGDNEREDEGDEEEHDEQEAEEDSSFVEEDEEEREDEADEDERDEQETKDESSFVEEEGGEEREDKGDEEGHDMQEEEAEEPFSVGEEADAERERSYAEPHLEEGADEEHDEQEVDEPSFLEEIEDRGGCTWDGQCTRTSDCCGNHVCVPNRIIAGSRCM